MPANRICKICYKDKAITAFTKNKKCLDGREHTCRTCTSIRALKWEEANFKKHKNSWLKNRFGINGSAFDKKLEEQNGVCAICFGPETVRDPRRGTLKQLCVDHNHITGKVRGLLCQSCNISIGRFKESIPILKSAIVYLRKHNK